MDDSFDLIGAALSESGIDLELEYQNDLPSTRPHLQMTLGKGPEFEDKGMAKSDELPDFADLMGSSVAVSNMHGNQMQYPLSTPHNMPMAQFHSANGALQSGMHVFNHGIPGNTLFNNGFAFQDLIPINEEAVNRPATTESLGLQTLNSLNNFKMNGMVLPIQPVQSFIPSQPPHSQMLDWNTANAFESHSIRPGILSKINTSLSNSSFSPSANAPTPFVTNEGVMGSPFLQMQQTAANPGLPHQLPLQPAYPTSMSSTMTKLLANQQTPNSPSLSPFSTLSPQETGFGKGNKLPTRDRESPPAEDVTVEEEETMTHAETFANYQPAKLKIGQTHPDPVVETSSLSSVQPPRIWYELALPEATIDSGSISALQLEAIVYSCQRHERFLANGQRAGFLIGDGAGVGKGRTIAGIIFENFLLDRKKALWVSVSNDLKYDAARDLKDIGAIDIPVYSLNKFRYAKISSKENGSIKKGVVFSTYSSLISESSSRSNNKIKSRLNQLVQWFKADFDGCIIFDECHRAKNLVPTGGSKPTKTGQVVLEIQRLLPKARIVYASATGASEPKNMAYMTRLGLWGEGTPFTDFNQFIQAVERRGVGAMEIVAMDMKLRGMYLARQLSFTGVSFKIEEVPLSADFERMYNESVALWVKAREYFVKACSYCSDEDYSPHRSANCSSAKMLWGQFWSSHQRFFKYLCIASKVRHVVNIARQGLKNGKCVVIGLQSTGEARTLEQLESMGASSAGDQLEDFVSTAKGVFQSLVEKYFPTLDNGFGADSGVGDLDDLFSPSGNKGGGGGLKGQKRSRGSRVSSGFNSEEESVVSDYEKQFIENSEFDDNHSDNERSEDIDNGEEEAVEFEDEDEEEEDVNPFAVNNSDGDDANLDCPWLKNSRPRKKAGKQSVLSSKQKKRKFEEHETETPSSGAIKRRKVLEAGLTRETGAVKGTTQKAGAAEAARLCSGMRNELLNMLDRLESSLPANSLDQLIDELGGTQNVAEMTGRKGRVVSNDAGNIQYEKRSEAMVSLEVINVTEKKRFMDLEKRVAIISEAASSGISLQADRRAKNQLKRIHITMELPWSADRAVQQFGRTHRSNQVHAPEYLLVISSLAGERRFASIVAKRLECLGALTHGDRRATETQDLSSFNIDNKYGRVALEDVYSSILLAEPGKVSPPKSFKGLDFFKEMQKCLVDVGLCEKTASGHLILDKDASSISKFLNRILGMAVKHQNALFEHFTNTLDAVILEEKKLGKFDLGILDLGKNGENIWKKRVETFQSEYQDKTVCELHEVHVERGVSFEDSLLKYSSMKDHLQEGFYVDKVTHGSQTRKVVLATAVRMGGNKLLYTITRPNVGVLAKLETLQSIEEVMKRVDPDVAKPLWHNLHELSQKVCSHQMYHGSCKRVNCDVGKRTRKLYVLSGSVLSVWNKVESVLAQVTNSKMQVIRLKTSAPENHKIVGLLIPANAVDRLKATLAGPTNDSANSSQQLPPF